MIAAAGVVSLCKLWYAKSGVRRMAAPVLSLSWEGEESPGFIGQGAG